MNSNNKYAKTLFDLSLQYKCTEMVQNQLKSIAHLFNKSSAFRLVLISKRLDIKTKVNVISKTLIKFNPLIIEFISIIINNNLANELLDIIYKFNRLTSSNLQTDNVDVIIAHKLNKDDIDSLSESIYNALNAKPKINVKHDANIIGGMKLRVGNKIFDNSVSYQINQLKKTLHNM
tara:strand:+ start:5174 stop:5701 length:528 start_codon:yes stop_codon:yes gene_type:complete